MTQSSTKLLKDYNVGESFDGHLLVTSATRSTAANGSDYLRVILNDISGSLTLMLWNVTDSAPVLEDFKTGNIVKVHGKISDYQGIQQLTMHDYTAVKDISDVDLTALVKYAPIDIDKTYNSLKQAVEEMDNSVIRLITLKILNDYETDFKSMPAAKSVHHAYRGGLLYHTNSMRRLGEVIAALYPELNRELLLSGIILHDIAKTIEYTPDLATEKTLEGRLKGHISIMSEIIERTARDLNIDQATEDQKETVILMQHMVLSHHGLASNGWGSPVSPQIIEAEILHRIDMIDANMDAYRNGAENIQPGDFTKRIFGLDNREMYKHKL